MVEFFSRKSTEADAKGVVDQLRASLTGQDYEAALVNWWIKDVMAPVYQARLAELAEGYSASNKDKNFNSDSD